MHGLDLKLVDLRTLRAAVVICTRIRASSVAVGSLSCGSGMRVSLSESMALLRHRSSFELINWHVSLTAIMVCACIRAVIVGTGVRSACKSRFIGVVKLIAGKILPVRVVDRRR